MWRARARMWKAAPARDRQVEIAVSVGEGVASRGGADDPQARSGQRDVTWPALREQVTAKKVRVLNSIVKSHSQACGT